jgi:plastocyanin
MKSPIFALLLAPALALAADPEVSLTLRDHVFSPMVVRVPAGQKVRLLVDNQDVTPEEFESYELNREKVIPPKSQGSVYVGPLAPGRYPFFGDFHDATARGVVVVE